MSIRLPLTVKRVRCYESDSYRVAVHRRISITYCSLWHYGYGVSFWSPRCSVCSWEDDSACGNDPELTTNCSLSVRKSAKFVESKRLHMLISWDLSGRRTKQVLYGGTVVRL